MHFPCSDQRGLLASTVTVLLVLGVGCGKVYVEPNEDSVPATVVDAGVDSDAAGSCSMRPPLPCTGPISVAVTEAIRRCGACLAFSVELRDGCATKIRYAPSAGTDAGLVDFVETETCVWDSLQTYRFACAPQGETNVEVSDTCGM